jgi:hypothetical protein
MVALAGQHTPLIINKIESRLSNELTTGFYCIILLKNGIPLNKKAALSSGSKHNKKTSMISREWEAPSS